MDVYSITSGPERSFDDSCVSECSSSSSLDESDLRPEYFHSDSLLICDDVWDDLPDTSCSNDFGRIIKCSIVTDLTDSHATFTTGNIRNVDGSCETLNNCDVTFLVGPLQQPVYSTKSIIQRRCSALYKCIISHEEHVQRQHKSSKKNRPGFLKFFRFVRKRIISKSYPRSSKQNLQQTVVIEVPEFEPDIFGSLINFIHTGEISINSSNVLGILAAAKKYGLHDLSTACDRFVGSSRSISSAHDQNDSGSDYIGSCLVTGFPYGNDCHHIGKALDWKKLSGDVNCHREMSKYGYQQRTLSSSSNNSNSAVSLESGYNSGEVDNAF